jgi:hypothetical protein
VNTAVFSIASSVPRRTYVYNWLIFIEIIWRPCKATVNDISSFAKYREMTDEISYFQRWFCTGERGQRYDNIRV